MSRALLPGEAWDDPDKGTRDEIPNVAVTGIIMSVDVHNGVVGVRLKDVGYRNTVKLPIFQVSIKGTSSSWFRFMPQVGDIVTLVQNQNGAMHIVGYEVLNYQQIAKEDEAETFLFRELQQGEFEIRSKGMASIFGSDTGVLRLAGGPAILKLDRQNLEASLESPLIKQRAMACEIRFGEVRRRVLPTDFEDTALVGGTLREFRLVVAREVGPASLPMVDVKVGDVVQEIAPAYPLAVSGFATPLRVSARVLDPSGLLGLFGLRVDALGNLEVVQAVGGQMVLQPGLTIRLGGSTATEPLVLGLVLNTFLTNLIAVLQGAVVATPVGPGTLNPATIAALQALIPQLTAHLSTVAFTQLTATPGVP
jgi:hypothetical protein